MFYEDVPRTMTENAKYRMAIRKHCSKDPAFRRQIMAACREDVLFWLSTFCFLYEPRLLKDDNGNPKPHIIPMIPWEHQEPIIRQLRDNLGNCDIGAEKSRGEGMSWIAILLAVHDWLFEPMSMVGFVSRSEDMADSPDDPNSLMWKALTLDTRVLTPTGWRLNGELAVGDMVIGSDGRRVKITNIVDHGIKPVYRVSFHDGTSVRCCGDHLWTVTTHKDRLSGARWTREVCPTITLPTHEIAKRIFPDTNSQGYNYQVQKVAPVTFSPSGGLPIPPYSLGALLGDGTLAHTSIGLSVTESQIADRMRQELPMCSFVPDSNRSVRITGGNLSKLIRELGLRRCRAWDKFIPPAYLMASVEDRVSLLRGIMDTDGWITKNNGVRGERSDAFFETTSKQLAEDVAFLSRSIGCLVTEPKSYPRTYSYKGEKKTGRTAYRIGITSPVNPFFMSRKADRYRERKITEKIIRSAVPDGEAPVRCISVAAADHLYVVEGFTLTHNCVWEIDQLPKWMGGVPDKDYKRSRAAHTLLNLRNKSTIAAYSATGDVARGGRYKWFLMDELAAFRAGDDYKAITSTQYSTNSRLYVSTPQGAQGAYYDIMHSPSNMLRLQMHWSQNPSRNRGLYRFVRGRIVEDDPENNPLPIGYAHDNEAMFHRLRVKGYNLEKGIRSPWYDNECDRPGATPTFVAQELDLDYSGSKHLVFGNDFFEVTDVTVRSPAAKGMFALHPETLDIQFDRQPDGQVELWCALDHRGRPPVGSYVVSADLGSGLGGSYASNSVCQVINTLTQEQVLEYATNTVQVSDFADICVGVAKWFWDAYLAWEVQGPGGAMTRRVVERGYGNVYRRTVLWKSGRKKVKEVGWNTDTRSKEVMFAELIRAVRAKEFTLRSKACVTECRQYIMINGKIEHSLAKVTTDDSSKGQAHGDRVIALAVGIQAAKDRPGPALKEHQDLEQNPPPNTMAYRMKLWEQQKQKDDDGWSELINGVQSNLGFSPSQLGTVWAD